ncbi:MAG: hypothetical protein Q9211_004711 [Gyalolechia sp. 1 TL-2023]
MSLSGPAAYIEWAWQNYHITKKVTADQRSGLSTKSNKSSKPADEEGTKQPEVHVADKKPQKSKQPKRPRVALKKGLSVLHLLLRVPSFSRWPLAVRFFCSDVHQAWLESSKKLCDELRSDLHVSLDERQLAEPTYSIETPNSPQARRKRGFAPSGIGGIEGLDITYSSLKSHIEKSVSLVIEHGIKQCSVCMDQLDLASSTVIICPSEGCRAVSHMACLARECSQDPLRKALLPIKSRCPQCHVEHRWIDLVRELSLRVRGKNDIAQILKERRVRKIKATEDHILSADPLAITGGDEAARDNQMLAGSVVADDLLAMDSEDDPLPDDWHELGEDSQSVASTDSRVSSRHGSPIRHTQRRQQLPAVIEDSEWDSAEILD